MEKIVLTLESIISHKDFKKLESPKKNYPIVGATNLSLKPYGFKENMIAPVLSKVLKNNVKSKKMYFPKIRYFSKNEIILEYEYHPIVEFVVENSDNKFINFIAKMYK